LLPAVAVAILPGVAHCQIAKFPAENAAVKAETREIAMPDFRDFTFRAENIGAEADPSDSAPAQESTEHHGFVSRLVRRGLEDQKGLYLAPFKPSNFKWDALMLGGAAVFFATDRHIENTLPGGHYQFYQDTSNIAIAGLATSLAGVWLYGAKTQHHHARETGMLELETLVNTFLIYTPMQLIAGRQRPGEGNGHGDFLRHHALNTSFPGGHAMFTWAMATVLAQEYSKPWVQVLAYTAAFAVTSSRFLARDHWSSDMWVGSGLGIAIGTNIFHAHCDPELSDSCKHHARKWYRLGG
jgi:membrane-associated phospholipid phosphatase